MTYPTIVLITSFGAVFFMMNFIVPMFADVFKRFGGDLPFITALIVKISKVFSKYFILFFLVLIATISFIISQRKKQWFREHSTKIVLKIPLIGRLSVKYTWQGFVIP